MAEKVPKELKEKPETVTIHDEGSSFEQAKKEFNERQKDFEKELRQYEPYDLSELERIASKAIKASGKVKNHDIRIKHLKFAIEEIDLRINNTKSAYHHFEPRLINEPEDFQEEIERAENIRKQIEIEIKKLELVEPEAPEIHAIPLLTEVPLVKTSISESKSDKVLMNKKELAGFLGISSSTVYKWDDDQGVKPTYIPTQNKKGEMKRYHKDDAEKWLEKRKTKHSSKQPIFIFTENIHEKFADIFAQKDYLDDFNATIMKTRFSEVSNKGKKKILWNKSLLSLMTFVYLADRLDFIDKNKSETRLHNKITKKEIKEKKDGIEKEVQYQVLLKDNFNVTIESFDKARFSPVWEEINEAICEIRKELVRRKNPAEKRDTKEILTRKETIENYFGSKIYISNKIIKGSTKSKPFCECIDETILNIVKEIWIDNKESV